MKPEAIFRALIAGAGAAIQQEVDALRVTVGQSVPETALHRDAHTRGASLIVQQDLTYKYNKGLGSSQLGLHTVDLGYKRTLDIPKQFSKSPLT